MALPKAKEVVSSNPGVVFSKSYCSYCVSVKKLLTELGASFKAIELDTESFHFLKVMGVRFNQRLLS
ncbi:unnamed protein product [Ilex paraguariensis]|uniref:Glutaredoxin domain-containing protein n=1 Tax=Ilex paraguariensis TaxID=185542 RepID=A0ABC8T2V9_9AQUA